MDFKQMLKELNELDSYSEFDEDIKTCFDMVRLQDVERVIDKYKTEMFDKEKFKKEYVRMLDSLRENHKGEQHDIACGGGIDLRYYAFETMEIIEKWSKEHPKTTMKDKFKEVFRVEPKDIYGTFNCPCALGFITEEQCRDMGCCDKCRADFWDSEYKPPVETESEDDK